MTNPSSGALDGRVLLFIGGVHKSGTTLLKQIVSTSGDVSVFEGTGVPCNEGQYLQNRIKPDIYLGELLFGFSEEAYLTEDDSHLLGGVGEDIMRDWQGYWNHKKRIWVEKSPPNIVRTRFLQHIFPHSKFLMMIRDPRTLFMASRKNMPWTRAEDFIEHWDRVYTAFIRDAKHLEHARLIAFEELLRAPKQIAGEVAEFLGTSLTGTDNLVDPSSDDEYKTMWNSFVQQGGMATRSVRLPEWADGFGYETGTF